MSVVLVNGDGNPAVHASQDADLLGGIGGQETGILDINDKFAATIADANTVEISSGVCITKEGRRIQIDVGDVEEIVVPTGSQGTTKYYIIGFHLYTDGSGNQLAETFIDEVASPSATITEKMFKDGETEVYVSLYRITRNGLNLEGLTLILPEIGSLAGGGIIGNTDISGIGDGTVTGAIAQINTDLSIKYDETDDWIYCKLNGTYVKWRKANLQGLVIYDQGYENPAYAFAKTQGTGTITRGASTISFDRPSNATQFMCKTAIDVDVTNYTKITINTSSSSGTGLKYIYVGNTSTYYAYLDVASSGEHVIDVSGATGSYPITVVVNATTNSSASLVLNSIILT